MAGNARAAAVAFLLLSLAGCGQVGEPVYPSLNIPVRITDLRVVERGGQLAIDFTIPSITTDGVAVKRLSRVDLRAGDTDIPVYRTEPGAVHASTPAAPFVGREITLQVRVINAKGKASEWSNSVTLNVVPPLAVPTGLRAENANGGVKLAWSAPGENRFLVLRDGAQVGETASPEFLDKNVEYGKRYAYSVQALAGAVVSDVAPEIRFTPQDEFPPAVPTGLTASAGIKTIELAWDRNTEPDFKAYRVYRSVENSPFEKVADAVEAPAYSDSNIQTGKHYRYAVSAVDQAGNESRQSAPIEATAP